MIHAIVRPDLYCLVPQMIAQGAVAFVFVQ